MAREKVFIDPDAPEAAEQLEMMEESLRRVEELMVLKTERDLETLQAKLKAVGCYDLLRITPRMGKPGGWVLVPTVEAKGEGI
jgi:cephalosporin-C deacetylase-like acetyl esterase